MTKINCKYTGKTFEKDLNPILTLVECPFCKLMIKFKYGYLGLSFDVGVKCKDTMHKIIYKEDDLNEKI